MVKVLEEKPVPRAEIVCQNCISRLEYGNADLHEDFDSRSGMTAMMWGHLRPYYFICPVCGCKVSATWVQNKEEQ